MERALALALIAVVAALYGASAESDTYFLALIVPITLGVSLSEALYTAFLPRFSAERPGGSTVLRSALRLSVTLAALVTGLYVAVLLVASPGAIDVWLVLAVALFATPVTGTYAALLTARRRYVLAVMRVPLATSVALATLAALHALVEWRSTTALATAIAGGTVASLATLAAQAHGERSTGAAGAVPVRSVTSAVTAVFVATAISGQLVVVCERFLASTLAAGAVTLLVFARGFALLPVLVPQALASGLFPAASERHATLAGEGLSTLALRSVRLGVLSALVSAVVVVACRRELVRAGIERGELGDAAAGETARLIAVMAVSLVGIAVASIAGKALFAMGRQRSVALVSAFGIAVYIGVALALRAREGTEGLAAAFSISSLVTGFALAAHVARVVRLPLRRLLVDWVAAPSLLAACFAAGAVPARMLLDSGEGFWSALATLLAVALAGTATLTAAILVRRGYEYELLRGATARWAQ